MLSGNLANSLITMEAFSDTVKGESIKGVFDIYFKNISIDRNFIKKVSDHVLRFETKNEEHVQFLGSHLLGVYAMKYLNEDSDAWIDEVLEIDDWYDLEEDYHDLTSVDPSFNVTGSVLNASYVYVCHRILADSKLTQKEKDLGAVSVMKMFQYKFLASILNHFFPYRTQESIALALYESLSRKSLLKKYGSWGALVEARANDIVDKSSIHYKTLLEMKRDKDVLYVISDIQSRNREIAKKLNMEYRRLKDEDARVMSEGHFLTMDEETVLKDVINNVDSLRREMEIVIFDKHDLIRSEIIEYTIKLVPTASERLLKDVLEFTAVKGKGLRKVNVVETINRLILFINDYQKGTDKEQRNLAFLIVKFRNIYRSSQQNNPDVLFVKENINILTDLALGNRNAVTTSGIRIATLVYLTLRILTNKHFR